MAEGTPAIVVPQVGVADVVLKAGAGFVVAPSAEAIADAVRQLQRNPEMRIIMGGAGTGGPRRDLLVVGDRRAHGRSVLRARAGAPGGLGG